MASRKIKPKESENRFAVVLDSGPSHKQLNAPRGSETCKSAELFGFSVLANTQYGEKCCGKAMATSQST